MKHISPLVFVVFICLNISQVEAQTRYDDSLSLVNLYNTTDGPNWTTTWDLNTNMDLWYGVTMAAGRVSELSLNYNNLSGPVPDLNLTSAILVFLHNNALTDTIPDFTNLPNLVQLRLDDNQLTGSIPDFANLPVLEYLELADNQLTGSIPDFTNLPFLRDILLSDNQLSGPIPNFANLSNLEYLLVYNNELSGLIPDFSSFPNMLVFFMYGNQFTFEDIIPYRADIQGAGIIYSYEPQDSVCQTMETSIAPGSPYILQLMVDDAVTSSNYNWYKDGVFYMTTSTNELSFASFQPSDVGVYHCVITNPNAAALSLTSRSKTLNSSPALPVELLSFEGKSTQEGILLNWQTAQETNNKYFDIQRSLNTDEWETIATLEGQGQSNQGHYYDFLDKAPIKGMNYYRLKQVDEDSSIEYSSIIAIHHDQETIRLRAFPNPNEGVFTLQLDRPHEEVFIQIMDFQGQVISEQTLLNFKQKEFDLPYAAGIYFLRIQTVAGITKTVKLMKL